MADSNMKKKGKRTPQSTARSEKSEASKMPSMRTATDVISRLQWDESLPKEHFVVGYLDRFEGIMEQPFTSLDWGDVASVDNYSLALPKHRIQYFKYKNRKVWDKTKRLDIIFGSTGAAMNIQEFMQHVDQEKQVFCEENYDVSAEENDGVLEDNDSEKEVEYETSDRPNFFIAVRITNADTVKNIKVVTDYMKDKDPLIEECCTTSKMLHVTLSILKLNSAEEINKAVSAMKSVAEKNLPPVTISLEGLDDFRQRVLFSEVTENDDLLNLRSHLVEELNNQKLMMADRFAFVPHVTIAKLSRPAARIRNSRYIDQYLYLKFEDNYFGTQDVKDLYLCEMGALPREDGFYKCAAEINIA